MSFTALPLSNEKVTAAKFGALISEVRPVFTILVADGSAFPSNITMADETGMSSAVTANVNYLFDAVVIYDAGATADIKLGWTFPTGSFFYTAWGLNSSSVAMPVVSSGEASGTAKTFGGQGIGTFSQVWYRGYYVCSANGTLQLQRAQSVSTAENTRVKVASWLMLRQAN